MPHKLMLPLLLLLASAVPLRADDSPVLTNDDIVQMVQMADKYHSDDSWIIEVIGRSHTNFDVRPPAMKAVRDAGASETVRIAMLKSFAGMTPVDTAAPALVPAVAADDPPAVAASSAAAAPLAAGAAAARKPLDPPQAPDPPRAGAASVPGQAPPAAAPAGGGTPDTRCSGTTAKSKFPYSGFVCEFVGGVEQSGYSSQANSTNAFLSAFFRSPYFRQATLAPSVWGRIRLLSAPLPSTDNVVAAITDPAGTITSTKLENVGQVVDYVFGPEIRLKQWGNGETDRISFVAGVGATTPLTSNQVQYSLQAPPADSQQCLQLVAQYPTFLKNVPTTSSPGNVCTLINAITGQKVSTISFAAQDRSNFLVKFAGGLRLAHIYPAKDTRPAYSGVVDFLIGQDESITGGRFHSAVFRVDGVYPLLFGASEYLYLFGSASMKFTKNISPCAPNVPCPPIVLATATNPSLPLATNVALLPLTQPNRDFYRFGAGLNILSIFTKLTAKTTAPSAGGQGGAPTKSGNATAPNAAAQVALKVPY